MLKERKVELKYIIKESRNETEYELAPHPREDKAHRALAHKLLKEIASMKRKLK